MARGVPPFAILSGGRFRCRRWCRPRQAVRLVRPGPPVEPGRRGERIHEPARLTSQDVLEQGRIHGITTGIPIADDRDKGVYFVTHDGRIMFRAAGRNVGATEVVPSSRALSRFEIADEA